MPRLARLLHQMVVAVAPTPPPVHPVYHAMRPAAIVARHLIVGNTLGSPYDPPLPIEGSTRGACWQNGIDANTNRGMTRPILNAPGLIGAR